MLVTCPVGDSLFGTVSPNRTLATSVFKESDGKKDFDGLRSESAAIQPRSTTTISPVSSKKGTSCTKPG